MFDRFTKLAATSVLAMGVATGASAQGLGSYSGPYVGLMLGYGAADIESEVTGGTDRKESMTGFDLAGFVGWEVRDERLYYSIEAELLLPYKQNDIGNAAVDSYEKSLSYGANIRGGYFLTDGTMIYALAGLEVANFELETAGGAENEESVFGLRIGGGAEIRATDSLSIRAEYIYTTYEDLSLGLANTTLDVSDSTFRVGGVYRFSL